jgi:hypothetical protein
MIRCFKILLAIAAFSIACVLIGTGCAQKDNISGKWNGKLTLPATGKSLKDLEFSIEQKGSAVNGTMTFNKPGSKLPITGTVHEGKVTLTAPMKNGLAISFIGIRESRKRIAGQALLDYDTPQLGKRQDRTMMELTR